MARTTVYNKVVDDESYKSVNEENKELLDEFVDYLHSIDRSDLTIKNYISDIKIFYIWNLEHNKNKFFVDFTKREMIKYQNYMLNDMGVSSNRIRRLRASISSLSNFIESVLDDDFPNFRNIINKIPAPTKQEVREKTVLQDEEAQKLLDFLVEKGEYQQACVFALAWGSGSRKSELLRFKISYFTDENVIYGSLYKTPEKMKTKGRGKLGKQIPRYVLKNKFKPYFDLWIEERKRLGVDENIDDLFVVKKLEGWQPMKVSSLNYYAELFSKHLNVDFYFHCLRHNFTTGLVKAGVPADVIKDIVGWSSLDMVNLYTDIEIDDRLGDFFDEDGIKEIEKKNLSDL